MARAADTTKEPFPSSGIILTIQRHYVFFICLVLLVILNVLVLTFRPKLPGFGELAADFYLFGLALQSVVFISIIGAFLLYRWLKTGRKVTSSLVWAIAFLCYSSTFIGLMLQSLGFPWANSSNPGIFFLFRQTMIWWIGLMYVGIASIMTKSRKKRLVPGIMIIGLGYLVFGIGLLVFNDIEYTMYILLYTFWTPLCAAITYCFYLYGRDSKLASPKIIGIGFALLGLTYLAWSPWQNADVRYIYYIWFFVFNISLAIILVGYVILPYEARAKMQLRED
jgi:hypothetical protein